MRVWSGSERTTERTGGTRTDASFMKTMPMQCAWCYETRCITRTKCKTTDKNPTTEEIINHISGKGKSWSYEYGKLYPGRYNTPPLREDLIPRSRMAPEGKQKRTRRGKTKLLLRQTSETMNLERLNKLKGRTQQRWMRLQQSIRKEEQGTLR